MEKVKNRWLMACCAVGIHISIGSIYAWSQIAVSIKKQLTVQWGLEQITLTFSIAILFLGLSTAFMGRFVESKGPRMAGFISAILFAIGLIGSSIALNYENLWLLYLSYGVCGGSAMGLGYIAPVSTLLKWFPERRGLAMGVAIMGFGFGGALEVFLLQDLLPYIGIVDISTGLLVIACLYFCIMCLSSLYLSPPPKGWSPIIKGNNKQAIQAKREPLTQITAHEAIKTPQFYYLWIMFFINITCGVAVISVAKFMGIQVISLSPQMAAVMVILMSLANGCGRISWATISDYLTRPITYMLLFVIQIVSFSILIHSTNTILFQFSILLILTCYGGGFSMIPAFIGDVFGTKEAGVIHGYILTACAAAGLVGPSIIAYLVEATGGYTSAFYIFISFLSFAFFISILMYKKFHKLKREKETMEIKIITQAA